MERDELAKAFAKALKKAPLIIPPVALAAAGCSETVIPPTPDTCSAQIEVRKTSAFETSILETLNMPLACNRDTEVVLNPAKNPRIAPDSWLKLIRDIAFTRMLFGEPLVIDVALVLVGGIATGLSKGFIVINRNTYNAPVTNARREDED